VDDDMNKRWQDEQKILRLLSVLGNDRANRAVLLREFT